MSDFTGIQGEAPTGRYTMEYGKAGMKVCPQCEYDFQPKSDLQDICPDCMESLPVDVAMRTR